MTSPEQPRVEVSSEVLQDLQRAFDEMQQSFEDAKASGETSATSSLVWSEETQSVITRNLGQVFECELLGIPYHNPYRQQ